MLQCKSGQFLSFPVGLGFIFFGFTNYPFLVSKSFLLLSAPRSPNSCEIIFFKPFTSFSEAWGDSKDRCIYIIQPLPRIPTELSFHDNIKFLAIVPLQKMKELFRFKALLFFLIRKWMLPNGDAVRTKLRKSTLRSFQEVICWWHQMQTALNFTSVSRVALSSRTFCDNENVLLHFTMQ